MGLFCFVLLCFLFFFSRRGRQTCLPVFRDDVPLRVVDGAGVEDLGGILSFDTEERVCWFGFFLCRVVFVMLYKGTGHGCKELSYFVALFRDGASNQGDFALSGCLG